MSTNSLATSLLRKARVALGSLHLYVGLALLAASMIHLVGKATEPRRKPRALAPAVNVSPASPSPTSDECNFLGIKDHGRRIIFVCEASGSILDSFDALCAEMRRSIDQLGRSQSFNIIIFQSQDCSTISKTALLTSDAENKARSYAFLDAMIVGGETDPMPGLKLALEQMPDVIYLIEDGDFMGPGNNKIVEFCKQKAAEGKVRINTIAITEKETAARPPDLRQYLTALRSIAENSGGQFKPIMDRELSEMYWK